MAIDFKQITGLKGSRADNFAMLCTRLILAESPEACPVEGKGGDEGLDTFIGKLGGQLRAFQFKYFCERVRRSQRSQIKASLETVLKNHALVSWTLVLPIDMNLHEHRWFQDLSLKYAPLKMECWGEAKLRNLLGNHPQIAMDFFEPPDSPAFRDILKDKLFVIDNKLELIRNGIERIIQIAPNQPTQRHNEILRLTAQDFINRSRLSVLIWGPSAEGHSELYKKRVQIRDTLRNLGHQAEFSEEVLTPNVLAAGGLNLRIAELIQARGYEYIVCIMGSPGSIGEVHDFCHIPEIAHKMTICVDENHLSSYGGQGILRIFEGNHGRLEKFMFPDDIGSCNLLRSVIDQVDRRAAAKQDQIARSIGY